MDNSDDENLFYFESDHLPLTLNKDYSNLLRSIALLEAQKIQVLRQIEELVMKQNYYKSHPHELLIKLKKGEEIIQPNQIRIVDLPDINDINKSNIEISSNINVKNDDRKTEEECEDEGEMLSLSQIIEKPRTYNKQWTRDEQKLLDLLLKKYPPEKVEMRRFVKISEELGTRTPLQVASRVQKYFKKLHSIGMPIPGRIPKGCIQRKKKRNPFKSSTFFSSYAAPVHMPQDETFFSNTHNAITLESDKYDKSYYIKQEYIKKQPINDSIRKQIIKMLSIIKEEKQSLCEGYQPNIYSDKCYVCRVAALSIITWSCATCACQINICSDCLISQLIDRTFRHFSHKILVEFGNTETIIKID